MGGPAIYDWTYCISTDCIVSGIYNWQTLIGALVAIGAAWYAGGIVRKQIKASDDRETARFNRRSNAVRSLLPLTLSGVSDYSRETASRLMEAVQGFRLLGQHNATPNITAPDVPHDLIHQIAAMIEATDDKNVISMLRKMVSEVQVLNSRMQNLQMELELEPDEPHDIILTKIDLYMLQSAVIYAQCIAMFDFARFKQETVPNCLTWESIFPTFTSLGIRSGEYPNLFDLCRNLQAEGKSPENL